MEKFDKADGITLKSEPGSVETAIEFVEKRMQASGVDGDDLFDIMTAFAELFENVIRHAYKNYGGTISVLFDTDRFESRVIVFDRGPEFDPTKYAGPDQDELIRNGISGNMGIKTMRLLTDGFSYRRESGRNITVLRKRKKIQAAG